MEEYWSKTHSFTDGAARFSHTSYFTATQDDLIDIDAQHTIFIAISENKWYQLSHVNWSSVGIVFITKPTELAIAISEDGQVWAYVGGEEKPEKLNHEPRLIRNIAAIKGEAYACGMDRQVFRRVAQGKWLDIHANKPKKGEALGFEAIDGFSEKEIYAVGWEGEIWRFDGSKWHNCHSPTNLILTGVHCASDGNVYVCGQEGMILQGRNDVWSSVSDEQITQDFWDVIEFDKEIYFASKTNIYELSHRGLKPITLEADNIRTTGRFAARDGVLWSIGEKDIFSFDGKIWTRVD